ncbi:hypothetical protein ZYGR_0AK03560 [Zygosaccharomyces rouxii]|uniref:CobW/HypB/UreG nucleotide-binding domain-containing protein n=1 Tax=Zygosaccharomyces rouxii TaxID=4956 RepID=A0A1Q3ADN1_ZYGRO|nr:hypothetical protein ZYGR_0AK03560 [Zygosaccharomyces rouxii]
MSALKDYKYKEEEDGELPSLVTGTEFDLNDILDHVKSDGGINIVSEDKIARTNLQNSSAIGTNNVSRKIPVSIITGYLGSGKSTLLEKLAQKGSDKKIAVILNEFGDSSEIEKAMTIRNGENSYEEWLDLGNGCLCCSLKNVGVKAIEDMIQRSPGKIDYILLETSGIADPAPIAKMFWQDEGLNSNVYIDGIITVLDCEHIVKCLDDVSEQTHWHGDQVVLEDKLTIAHLQIAMADRLIMNKLDRIEGDENKRAKLEQRIRSINSEVPMFYTKFADIGIDKLLDLHAFDARNVPQENMGGPTFHDPRMTTVTLDFRPLKAQEYEKFQKEFLQVLLWKEMGVCNGSFRGEVHRTKGLLLVDDKVKVIQGVRDTYEMFDGEETSSQACKVVFIGKNLDQKSIADLLHSIIK